MRVFFTILGIVLMLSNPFGYGQAQDLRFFRIGTGGVAGTYYPIAGMISYAISNPPGSLPCEQGGSCGPPGLIVIAQSANGSVANVDGIQKGMLDAFFVVAGYPARAITDLASDTEILLLPITGAEANQLISRYGFFSRDKIPAGTYPGVDQVQTVSVSAQWLVASSVDAETVYQITRSLWSENSRKLLDSGHVKGKHISLHTALDGITEPLHPGSRRFYREIGMAN